MITVTAQPLKESDQVALKNLLNSGPAALLFMVINAKCTTHLIDAMRPALECRDYDARLAITNTELQAAHRYQIALDVLQELKDQQEEYTTAKLS